MMNYSESVLYIVASSVAVWTVASIVASVSASTVASVLESVVASTNK